MPIGFVVHFGAQPMEACEGWNARGVAFGT